MKKSLRIVAALAAVGVVGGLAFAFVPTQITGPSTQLPDDWKPAEGQGKYAMYASDCMACHTADGGKSFAGGRAIASPMGTIWSTNITPDPETGIGNWTLDQFRAALQDGIRADGAHLYPAMPYENYRKLTEEDVRALYDYFMHEVEPVQNKVEETKLSFPFNMRFGIRAWNWLALTHDAGFTPATGKTEIEERGQYLVEGPAHCAACHSPRNALMAQDGVSASDANFLAGGVVGGWNAPSLRGPNSAAQKWDAADMAAYLATGRNIHSTANGEMGLVVQHSLQHLTDQDNLAIAAFLKGLDGAPADLPESFAAKESLAMPALDADEAGKETEKMLTEAAPDMALGPRLYLDNCAACHFVSGKGAPEIFPELAGNHLVTGSEVEPLISVILNGAQVPSTAKRPMHLVMQGYADRMNDDEVAELASFLRKGWGNDAAAVTAADVAKVREKQVH
ncbi:cytochrome c [Paracoccus sp. CPCC 101403]|uniref:Cytochrome c n=1 Tax=Paracoccus broussonetiae TaxID=3075834 RepID=A0ABU3ELK5_9RHOB|nr:cytochrome c [Paracoccus sp. CPCC 101403]MDT1064325.1 cytochrome c [Paracoccus sp. CPCC 101403]